jgi:hypothetical protein
METKDLTTKTEKTVKSNADESKRELAIKAKADADKKVISQITKKAETILKDAEKKAKTKLTAKAKGKETKKTTAKKAPKVTFVSELDKILQAGGTWKELVDSAEALNKKMNGHIKYNPAVLKAHIKFRMITSIHKNPNYLGELVVTENGIEKPKKAVKRTKKAA